MPEREQKKKSTGKERAREAEDVEVDAAPSKQAEALKEELDDLLDEIESNAEDFVRSYVQKGGE